MHDDRGDARLEGRLGTASREEGDPKAARAALADARDRSRALENRQCTMELSHELALLELETGNLAEAERDNRDEVELARALNDGLQGADAALLQARIAREKGDAAASRACWPRDARARFERAQVGAGGDRGDAPPRAARTWTRGRGRPPRLSAGRQAVEALHAGGYRAYEADALVVLARALLAEGKGTDASGAVGERRVALDPPARRDADRRDAGARAAQVPPPERAGARRSRKLGHARRRRGFSLAPGRLASKRRGDEAGRSESSGSSPRRRTTPGTSASPRWPRAGEQGEGANFCSRY